LESKVTSDTQAIDSYYQYLFIDIIKSWNVYAAP